MKEQFIQGPSVGERLAKLEAAVATNAEQIDTLIDIVMGGTGAVIFALGSMAFLWLKKR